MADKAAPNGCAFGRETRVLVGAVKESVGRIETMIQAQSEQIDLLFNHQSKKPSWLESIVITVLVGLVIGLSTYVITQHHPTPEPPVETSEVVE